MRQYVIDEISEKDMRSVAEYLDSHTKPSSIGGLYWLELNESLLTGIQIEHADCRPYAAAVEIGDGFVKFELLVRSMAKHNCTCTRYADSGQREAILNFADTMIEELNVRT